MFNKKSSTTATDKKKPSERIKQTIKSIVKSNDTKKNATDTKNKVTPVLNTNKQSESKLDIKTFDVNPKVLPNQNDSNESDEKITKDKPLVNKPFDASKKFFKKLSKTEDSKNNSNPIKPEQNASIKKRSSVASISSSSSVTSNVEPKNNIADSKRHTSSTIRSETSRPSTPDIIKKQSSKINLNPSRPTTPDPTRRPSSRLTTHDNSTTSTPDATRRASSRSTSSELSKTAAKRSTSIISSTNSRPATPELSKTTKRSTSVMSVTNSRPASPEFSKTTKRPTSIMSVTNSRANSRPASPEFSKTTKRPTSVIPTSVMSATNSRPASPELSKTMKRPTSVISVTNSRTNSRPASPELSKTTKRPTSVMSPAVPEVKAKQNRSTQQHDSSNIITKSKQLSQQTSSTSTPIVTKKRSVSILSTQSSRAPSPEITKLPESPLISETDIKPSTSEIIKPLTTETTRKHDVSRPSTPTSNHEIKKLPNITKRQRSNSSAQVSFSTTYHPTFNNSTSPEITRRQRSNSSVQNSSSQISFYITPNNLTLNSHVKKDRRTSFTSSITSQISDDNYFPRSSTPTSDTSAESNDGCKDDYDFKNISSSNEVVNNNVLEDNYQVLEDNNQVLEETNNVLQENNKVPEETNNEQLFMEKCLENNKLTSDTTQDDNKLTSDMAQDDDNKLTSDTKQDDDNKLTSDMTQDDNKSTTDTTQDDNKSTSGTTQDDDKNSTEINNSTYQDIKSHKSDIVVFNSEQNVTTPDKIFKICDSTSLDSLDNPIVIETSIENIERSNNNICNNLIHSDKNESVDEQDNSNLKSDQVIESLDESSKEINVETKVNAVELVNSMMNKIKTVKNVIDINGNKLPAIIEQDLDLEQNSIDEITNLMNQYDNMSTVEIEPKELSRMISDNKRYELKSTEIEQYLKESTNSLMIDCEKTHVIEQQMSQDNHTDNNTLKENLYVMQSNINLNDINSILYLSSSPAIIEHRTISVHTEPYKKCVGSYGTTPQDFIPFTNYETQDIVMCVDEKKFDEEIVSHPSLSDNIITKEEQQYYDVSISEDENLNSKYKMKKPSYGTFLDIYSCKNIF
ncbi:20239_t:CDS:2 [Cetraspora pellucida]|uniref:20239_t:CDS:1 n=1 Tax=Cetraspora pellucida TaxID=1433469 RepID=A0A9N8VY59_9GLOM|nr:20239_t:CDS:2 [Cetraspora pellucida]